MGYDRRTDLVKEWPGAVRFLNSVTLALVLVIAAFVGTGSVRWVFSTGPGTSLGPPGYEVSQSQMVAAGVLLAAVLWLLGQAVSPGRWRYSRAMVGWAILLAAGMIVSCISAGDKRAAINATAGMAAALLYLFVAWQVLDRPWKIRLAAAVLIGTAAAFACKCWMLQQYEFDQTLQHYLQTRQEFWARAGKTLDDPIVKVFEARMKSRDNGGFFFHSNLAGSFLMISAFLAVAVAWGKATGRALKYRRFWAVVSFLVAGVIVSALILTVSKGAFVAGAIGLGAAVVALRFGRRLADRFRTVAAVTVVGLLLAGAGVVGYGVTRGTLPSKSMAFRWQYWRASWRMFLDRPLRGVGPANFGSAYLKYKLPGAEEEVTNPHNFIVQAFCETGVPGGVALIGLAGAMLWTLAYPKRRDCDDSTSQAERSAPGSIGVWLVVLAAAFFVLRLIASSVQLQNAAFALVDFLPYMLCWLAGFLITAMETDRFDRFADDAESPLRVNRGADVWLAGAVAAFWAGNLVNFSLFEPGTAIAFFLLAAMALAARNCGRELRPRKAAVRWVCGAAVALLVFDLVWIVRPTLCSERAIALAQRGGYAGGEYETDATYNRLVRAGRCDTYNAQLRYLAAQRLTSLAEAVPIARVTPTLNRARQLLAEALDRNPCDYAVRVSYARVLMKLADLSVTQRDKSLNASAAVVYMKNAVRLNPTSRKLRIDYARMLLEAAKLVDDPRTSKTYRCWAGEQLRRALWLNEQLPADSLRRLPPQKVRWVNDQLRRLQSASASDTSESKR